MRSRLRLNVVSVDSYGESNFHHLCMTSEPHDCLRLASRIQHPRRRPVSVTAVTQHFVKQSLLLYVEIAIVSCLCTCWYTELYHHMLFIVLYSFPSDMHTACDASPSFNTAGVEMACIWKRDIRNHTTKHNLDSWHTLISFRDTNDAVILILNTTTGGKVFTYKLLYVVGTHNSSTLTFHANHWGYANLQTAIVCVKQQTCAVWCSYSQTFHLWCCAPPLHKQEVTAAKLVL